MADDMGDNLLPVGVQLEGKIETLLQLAPWSYSERVEARSEFRKLLDKTIKFEEDQAIIHRLEEVYNQNKANAQLYYLTGFDLLRILEQILDVDNSKSTK